MDKPASPQADRVECTAAKDPAVRLFILAAMLLGFGTWCLVEAYVLNKYSYREGMNVNAWANYLLNHFGPVVFVPAGLLALVWAVVFLRRKLVADEEGIGYLGKEKLAWGQVAELDASLLKPKGILFLRFDKGRKLTLDSWKLNNFREMVAFVEKRVPRDKHVVQ